MQNDYIEPKPRNWRAGIFQYLLGRKIMSAFRRDAVRCEVEYTNFSSFSVDIFKFRNYVRLLSIILWKLSRTEFQTKNDIWKVDRT